MKFNFFQQLRAVCDGPALTCDQQDVGPHIQCVEPMYYEVLDISLEELEQLKSLEVGWCPQQQQTLWFLLCAWGRLRWWSCGDQLPQELDHPRSLGNCRLH